MASIVSAGTTSATALNMSADTSGVLQLASNNGTVALTVSTLQNVGIGTTGPARKLVVSNAGAQGFEFGAGVGGGSGNELLNYNRTTSLYVPCQTYASEHTFYTSTSGGTLSLYLATSGNVGVGTGTPGFKLQVQNTSSSTRNGILVVNTDGGGAPAGVVFQGYDWVRSAIWHDRSSGFPLQIAVNPNTVDLNVTGLVAVASFSDAGRLFVNTTTEPGSNDSAVVIKAGGTSKSRCLSLEAVTTGSVVIQTFRNPNGEVGYIETNGSSTFYRTSSDYRLKDSVQPMTGALAKVALLKPVTYKWKVDGSDGQGFIAHELQEVVSEAVSGVKNGTEIQQYEISPAVSATYDEEGNVLTPATEAVMGEREVPRYQGIDTSFLVATLTAAIKELNAKVTDLEEQVLNLGVK
jgi:hypothetical protein